jgi:hypothetical protein
MTGWVVLSVLLVAAQTPSTASRRGKQSGTSHRTTTRQSASPRVRFLSYTQVKDVVQSFADDLPADLKGRSPAEREKLWPEYAAQHDREIRGRLAQGEEDSLNNLVLFGTSFTAQPRITAEFMEQSAKAQSSRPDKKETSPRPGGIQNHSDDPVVRAFMGRVDDFIRALKAPGKNERLMYMRQFLEGRGYGLATAQQQAQLEQYLLANFQRVSQEYQKYQQVLARARVSKDPSDEFAARSTLFEERGVSLDTSLMPNFALEEALRALAAKGLVAKGSVERVAIIGPGLDFVDKQEGYDFYPQQTIQPFLVMDSLFRLGLSKPDTLRVTSLDISARVNDHIERARARATNHEGYVMQLPIQSDIHWEAAALAYWKAAGETVGTPVAPVKPGTGVGQLQLRAVEVEPRNVLRITPVDLDIIYQTLDLAPDQRFDLVIATNMFTYYGQFEQALAMANLENMIRPGGFLLTNNGLPENVPVALHQVGFSTTAYSDRKGDGDHVIWYQR